MKRIGLIGYGKIGKALVEEIAGNRNAELVFIQDPAFSGKGEISCPVIKSAEESLYEQADLFVECANADVLTENLEMILTHGDLMPFSVTAFSDRDTEKRTAELCAGYHRHVYIPHGAILGLDGIFDGNKVWDEVEIETVKSPASFGRTDTERKILYDGPTRNVCSLFPKNVNVHAAAAIAGIGFDRTRSRLIADPDTKTNTHRILLKGQGIEISMDISSFAAGAVTGAYTPYSACGSLNRILGKDYGKLFV